MSQLVKVGDRVGAGDAAWTDEQKAVLKRMWAGGESTATIGARLGLSKNAVCGKARRMHLEARPNPNKRRQALSLSMQRPDCSMQRPLVDLKSPNAARQAPAPAHQPPNAARQPPSPARQPVAVPPIAVVPPPLPKPPMVALPVAQALAVLPVLPAPAGAVSIRTCQYPLWDDVERPTHRFCGKATVLRAQTMFVDGRAIRSAVPGPYCQTHDRVCYLRKARDA